MPVDDIGGLIKCLLSAAPPWSKHPVKFSGHKSCERGDIDFSNFHVTLRCSRDQKIMLL